MLDYLILSILLVIQEEVGSGKHCVRRKEFHSLSLLTSMTDGFVNRVPCLSVCRLSSLVFMSNFFLCEKKLIQVVKFASTSDGSERMIGNKESWINLELTRPHIKIQTLVYFALRSGISSETSLRVTYFKSFYKVFNNL